MKTFKVKLCFDDGMGFDPDTTIQQHYYAIDAEEAKYKCFEAFELDYIKILSVEEVNPHTGN